MSPLVALPGTLRKVTALVSVATIEIITAQAGMSLSPRKYPFNPFAAEPEAILAPRSAQPTM